MVGIASGAGTLYVERAHVADALFQAITIKQEMTALYAESGHWPAVVSVPRLDDQQATRPPPRVDYEEGAFTLTLEGRSGPYRMTFRAAVSETSPRSPVLWLCGHRSPPAGYRAVAVNRTDIPSAYLPAACRGES